MQIRSDIQLASMIQAMQKIIVPAIDPDNQLAVEQAQLTIGMLSLMAQQLPRQFAFDCNELERLLNTATSLTQGKAQQPLSGAALAQLAAQREQAAAVLADFKRNPSELHESILALREAIGELMTAAAADEDEALCQQAEQAILSLSKQQLLRERSLLKMQGWEANNPNLPDIASLLD